MVLERMTAFEGVNFAESAKIGVREKTPDDENRSDDG
jgi:hypothetical protein